MSKGQHQRSQTPGPNKKVDAKAAKVVCSRVKAIKAEDDCEATPICRMAFRINKGRKFEFDVVPDTGCSQTIVGKEMADNNCMVIDTSKKKGIRNASNGPMKCEGTTTFEVQYEGKTTTVEALVSSDMDDEMLMGWKAL